MCVEGFKFMKVKQLSTLSEVSYICKQVIRIFVGCSFLWLTATVYAADEKLESLIQQNIRSADKAYVQVVVPPEEAKKQISLWIHVRSEKQAEALEKVLAQIKNIALEDAELVVRPVQLVNYGPDVNNLRFFKQDDKNDANALLTQLVDVIPNIQLRNFSKRYKKITWIETGHMELWLAPNVTSVISADE